MNNDTTVRADFHLLPIEQLNASEWEALCDGCNKCCFRRSYNVETGRNYYTGTFCILLDPSKPHGCTQYARRASIVSECRPLTLDRLKDPRWLPSTCAYRLRAEHKPLPDTHPLFHSK